MRCRSNSVLFIAFLIEIFILMLYVTENSYSDWKLLLYFGFGDSHSTVKDSRSEHRTLIENVSLVFAKNIPEKRTRKPLTDMKYLNISASKTHNYLHVSVNKKSVDVRPSTLKAMGGASEAGSSARNESLRLKQSTGISDIGNRPSHGAVSAETRAPASRYLVCPEPYGRLGNMLFQYAASVGIAHKLHYKHVINPFHTLLKYFEMTDVWEERTTNVMTITEEQWKHGEWRNNKTYLEHNLTIFGYFQSWKYFQNISDEIRTRLTIKPYYLEKARMFLKENVPGLRERVGIHIRRGDFQTEVSINEGRVVANTDYIKKSMDYFRTSYEDVFFIVLSDDMQWCRDNVRGDDVIFSPFDTPITDMAIMTLCDHMIITVGSFGWWGGWLSGGTVVYLKEFPRPGSQLDKVSIKRKEYYLPEWIGLSNG